MYEWKKILILRKNPFFLNPSFSNPFRTTTRKFHFLDDRVSKRIPVYIDRLNLNSRDASTSMDYSIEKRKKSRSSHRFIILSKRMVHFSSRLPCVTHAKNAQTPIKRSESVTRQSVSKSSNLHAGCIVGWTNWKGMEGV